MCGGFTHPRASRCVCRNNATLFDQMVDEGELPTPFRMRDQLLWDRLRLDSAIDHMQNAAIPGE